MRGSGQRFRFARLAATCLVALWAWVAIPARADGQGPPDLAGSRLRTCTPYGCAGSAAASAASALAGFGLAVLASGLLSRRAR